MAAAFLTVVACSSDGPASGSNTSPSAQVPGATSAPTPPGATADRPFGARTRDSGCTIRDNQPDHACTPGAIFPNVTVAQVCQPGYPSSVRNVPVAISREVYREYGILERTRGEYEVDHSVPLEVGGSNDVANLWPEAAEPRPGFHEKDQVENYLHEQVCAGRLKLFEAQRATATNWLEVYRRLRQPGLPVVAPSS
ncbi:MAG: HNH endonuclease [Chloroflexota bacterium]